MQLYEPVSNSLGLSGRRFCDPGLTFGISSPHKSTGFYEVFVMSAAEKKINQCVEGLCSQGCNRVSGFIAEVKTGEEFPEMAGLNTQQRQQVLDELVSVMAAYEGKCER